ncbi:methylase [Ligilactobacillus ruminis DSM 20403 = NBRC 102161]|uniref:Type I restriction modification DNA specificity domain-containing protein n=3 Tax=Ligilactobacillus ruminis TaxID=1623 RepID=A0A1I2RCH3_9LACO|nr:Putative methylase [Ligilactobacillus ruminis ATCC 27782]KRM82671.1 methylase [Ligilactobacillus ruminis DSM 20403 = NBRC 102161]SFG38394.1 Type I restriction modification DNA specificity domain-containing protein [Ligilactobacillus ruminis DSM 20403 = NBRC 102161]
MKKLSENTWNAFSVDSLFPVIEATKGKTTAGLVDGDRLPYIAAAKSIIGCKICSAEANGEWASDGNGMVFVQIGDGAAGLAHYVPISFIGMSGKTSVGYSECLNVYNGLFIERCLSSNKAFFSHGHSWTGKRLAKTKVMLPVDNDGEPGYAYMAEYAQQKRDAMLAKYRAYVEARIAELGEYVEIPKLDEKEWKEYALEKLFSVSAGKRLTNADKIDGNRPFIGATDNSNGITGFVGNSNSSCDKNILGVNYNGAPCIAFYHPYECIFTDDVKRLHLLHHEDNEYVLLFFKTIVMQQRTKYSYGYKFKEKRMLRQKLMIPIDDDGKPDYEYMEQYAKNMMLRKYEQYLTFLRGKE